MYIGVAVLALLFMITVHELGHYLTAKALGFRINEFSIGFGKAIYTRKSKKTGEIFSLRVVPLGGYCAFDGEDAAGSGLTKAKGENAVGGTRTLPTEQRAGTPYNETAPWKRLVVLFSGAFANLICGIIFSLVLVMCVGYYHTVTIADVDPNAAHLGGQLHKGDVVTKIDGKRFSLLNNYSSMAGSKKVGDDFQITVMRDGAEQTFTIHRAEYLPSLTVKDGEIAPYAGTDKVKQLGFFVNNLHYEKMSLGAGLGKAFVFTGELSVLILSFLGKMVVGKVALSEMGGTFSTIAVMSEALSYSMINMLILIPLISINLAIFNWLPIPALDGSRMVFVAIEWIRGRPVNPEIENRIHMIGLLCLLGFVLLLDLNYLVFQKIFGG